MRTGATITAVEHAEIREYNNARARAWRAKQSHEERRARRKRYALNAISRAKGNTGRKMQKKNRSNGN